MKYSKKKNQELKDISIKMNNKYNIISKHETVIEGIKDVHCMLKMA